jgi:hypothetical protein
LKERRGTRVHPGGDDDDPIHLACLLRLGGERRGEDAGGKDGEEGSPVH